MRIIKIFLKSVSYLKNFAYADLSVTYYRFYLFDVMELATIKGKCQPLDTAAISKGRLLWQVGTNRLFDSIS